MQPFRADQLAVDESNRRLNAGRAHLPQKLVALLALLTRHHDQRVVVVHAASTKAGGLLEHVVRLLPVVSLEAHLLAEAGNDPPVGSCLPGSHH